MILLLPPAHWDARAAAARGPLAPLAEGIARDLEDVLTRPLRVPEEKARLSREGGRCPRDGNLLEFDPFEEHRHRCAACGGVYDGPHHRGFWRYWYHLWLAERGVHAAVLFRLRGDPRHAAFAAAVLEACADRYLGYPNRDNVLGPGRVFFSTYLESIWLLQQCIALDALEGSDPPRFAALGSTVRERLVAPALAIIASYDEAMSNRQVWNVAAMLAAHRVLGDDAGARRLVSAPHGLIFLLMNGILDDGSWYEGENYHMFAHRGLWYAVTMAEAAAIPLPESARRRFDAGFVAPFLTALPDMTLPSRRDSQYAISLRQPRFAEACELGLARGADRRLAGLLAALYDEAPDVPARNNGRARTAADVERNLPAMRLSRADLSWRALLFAVPRLPAAPARLPGSVLMEGQGIAVIRRDAGRVYAALDYGHTGGGHGHPDRLNLLLAHGATRVLDDMGTGSYVERALHWYRSTLAHNAPLIDGHSQRPAAGRLVAFEDRGGAGWIRATWADPDGRATVERTVVVMSDYLLDQLAWSAAGSDVTVDLPIHAPLRDTDAAGWQPDALTGGGGLEDGFDFVSDTHRRPIAPGTTVELCDGSASAAAAARLVSGEPADLWRLVAPGPPGSGLHTFHMVRMRGRAGSVRTVWSWGGIGAPDLRVEGEVVTVTHEGGASDTHRPATHGWHIDLQVGAARSSIDLGGLVLTAAGEATAPTGEAPADTSITIPVGGELTFALGEREYRRSEDSWDAAGCPSASGSIAWDGAALAATVRVRKRDPLVFVPSGADNPLDNEVPEINGDGIQVYLRAGGREGGWTIVPVPDDSDARAVAVRGWQGIELARASWRPLADGWEVAAEIPLRGDDRPGRRVELGLIVNETAPGRERRRGQLVLGGLPGEWVYLRGDRHDRARLLPLTLPSGDV